MNCRFRILIFVISVEFCSLSNSSFLNQYQNCLLIRKEEFDKEQNSTEITKYEYYENGRLKRRLIGRIPKLEDESVYVGGPGSDDEFYKYKLDSEGRIKVFYRIINGKKYRIAVYRYE